MGRLSHLHSCGDFGLPMDRLGHSHSCGGFGLPMDRLGHLHSCGGFIQTMGRLRCLYSCRQSVKFPSQILLITPSLNFGSRSLLWNVRSGVLGHT
jgi:hypothetical protein